MRKFLVFIFIIGLAFLGYGPAEPKSAPQQPEKSGEKIVYSLKLHGITIGRAIFSQLEKNLVTFETIVTQFHDLEKIYSDPKSFLPLKVERDIKTLAGSEKISEIYDQKNFVLTINKLEGGKSKKTVIRKKAPIHNAILLPFFVRLIPNFAPGWSMKIQLPTQSFEIRFSGTEQVKTSLGKYKCYRFDSVPKRFEIWITSDERRIPVKIRGSDGIGYTMLLREYNPGPKK
jgi:hypothetical protein